MERDAFRLTDTSGRQGDRNRRWPPGNRRVLGICEGPLPPGFQTGLNIRVTVPLVQLLFEQALQWKFFVLAERATSSSAKRSTRIRRASRSKAQVIQSRF